MVLEVVDITYSYGREPVLKKISFSVEDGSVVSIVGPNGSGKTTLLKCIAQVLRPRGVVYVDGRNLTEERYNAVSKLVFSLFGMQVSELQKLTVLDVLLMGRYPERRFSPKVTEEDLQVVEGVAKDFDLVHLLDRYITELSDGERQRVLLARAIIQDPKVLILDEPVSHLDLRYQLELLRRIREWCIRRKRIVIMALHDLNLASVFSDRVLVLWRGEVVAYGRPSDVLTPELVCKVYGVHDVMYLSLWTRYVVPTPLLNVSNYVKVPRLHVFCGYGSTLSILPYLRYLAHDVRCGPVPEYDVDAVVAKALGYRVYVENSEELLGWLSSVYLVVYSPKTRAIALKYISSVCSRDVITVEFRGDVEEFLSHLRSLIH